MCSRQCASFVFGFDQAFLWSGQLNGEFQLTSTFGCRHCCLRFNSESPAHRCHILVSWQADLIVLKVFRFLYVLLLFLLTALFTQAQQAPTPRPQGPVRLVVKVHGTLAQNIESALPLAEMALLPGQSGDPSIEDFMRRHGARRLAPLYPGIVRLKREQGLSDAEIAARMRQQFPRRAARLRASFNPPEISRTYVLELDSSQQNNVPAILNGLRSDPGIEYAEPEHLFSINSTENDPYLSEQRIMGTKLS